VDLVKRLIEGAIEDAQRLSKNKEMTSVNAQIAITRSFAEMIRTLARLLNKPLDEMYSTMIAVGVCSFLGAVRMENSLREMISGIKQDNVIFGDASRMDKCLKCDHLPLCLEQQRPCSEYPGESSPFVHAGELPDDKTTKH